MALSLTTAHPYLSLTDGGYYFRVTGTGFVSGLTFTIGGVAGTVGYVEYSTTFWGYTPANPAGVYDLVVTLPDNQTATLTNAFTYVDNTAGYVPPGAPEGVIIPRRIESLSSDTVFAAPLKPNTLFWFVDNAGDAIVYGCVLSYVHKGEGAFASESQWASISPTYFRFNNTGNYYIAFRLGYRQYAYATLRPSGCADLVLSSEPPPTDARAITLRPEVMGTPSPSARSVRLAVEVLMNNPLPITVTPQTRHLRFTGYAAADARARTLSAEVMSVGVSSARARRLAVEAMFSVVEASDVTQPGHIALSGHAPTINVTNYQVAVTLLGVEVLGQESSAYLPTQIAEPNSSQINIAARRWPMGLPGPSVDNYGWEYQDTSLRSAMDTGPGKVRRRFSAASLYVTATWTMDRTQLHYFNDWYVGTLQRGTLSFLWPDPWTKPYHVVVVDPTHTHNGAPVTPNVNGCCQQHPWVVMLSGDSGNAKAYELQYTWMTARFRKLNPYKPIGGTKVLESNVPATPTSTYSSLALLWEVSAELEILP